jgi:hypothetical protein
MFRSVSNNCICRETHIRCWLENLRENESLEGLRADERDDNISASERNRKVCTGLIWLWIMTNTYFLRQR